MQEDPPKIILVDDEPKVLDGLRRALQCQRKNWNMPFCEEGKEALQ
jgi:YesN/AraC family two-component response regulator